MVKYKHKNIIMPKDKNTNIPIVIKRALDKIKVNVWFIYENPKIEEETKERRKKLHIPDNFFNKYQISDNSDNIYILVGRSIKVWYDKILSNNNTLDENILDKIIKNLGGKDLKTTEEELAKSEAGKDTKAAQLNADDIYERLCKQLQLNPNIWRFVFAARLFDIPQKIVFKCIDSLLESYFPTIDDSLKIQINELTTIGDIEHIRPKIEKKQKMFKDKYKFTTREKYANHDRDKFAYELQKEGKTYKQIKSELKKKEFKKVDEEYISKILGAYKKFIGGK